MVTLYMKVRWSNVYWATSQKPLEKGGNNYILILFTLPYKEYTSITNLVEIDCKTIFEKDFNSDDAKELKNHLTDQMSNWYSLHSFRRLVSCRDFFHPFQDS